MCGVAVMRIRCERRIFEGARGKRAAWMLGLLLMGGVPCAGEPGSTAGEEATNGEVSRFVDWLLEDEERFESVAFADVVRAVSGRKVIPVDPSDPVDAEFLETVAGALDRVEAAVAAADHPIHGVGRVNEISGRLEKILLAELEAADGFSAELPKTADGRTLRTGYPDIRLAKDSVGRVFYLDPKVFRAGTETSGFRTFYFEPKGATNKILEDASHVIVGIPHSGKRAGRWRLDGWKLVDLADFRVRLKAEFQASNRDLYREAAVVRESDGG